MLNQYQENAFELWQIAENGETRRLKEVLDTDTDIDAANSEGVTALMRAAAHGRTEMVEALIGRGADINATRADGFTALALAAFFGHAEVVRILVEHGADLSAATRFGTSADMWASARSFRHVAQYLGQQRNSGDQSEELPIPVEAETDNS